MQRVPARRPSGYTLKDLPGLLSSARGFTLMEIMIVVAIIAAVVAIGAPRIANQKGRMRSEIQRIAVLSREIHNAARLQNRTFRLVFDIQPDGQTKYYVESTAGQAVLLTEEQQKELDEKTDLREEELAQLQPNKFELDTKFVKEPEELPGGLKVELVEIAGRKNAIKPAGGDQAVKAMIHYLPQGLTEQAVIQFSDGKSLAWTITIHPLTGKAYVHDKRLTLKDVSL